MTDLERVAGVKQSVVETPPLLRRIAKGDSLVMLGSCFAQYMGERMEKSGYEVVVNPLGTLFNPFSIGATVRAALHAEGMVFPIFAADGEWRCWWANTRVKAATPDELNTLLRQKYQALGDALKKAHHLIITMGTNVCYKTPKKKTPHPPKGGDFVGEAGREMLEAGREILEADRVIPEAGREILEASCKMLEADKVMLEASCKMLEADKGIPKASEDEWIVVTNCQRQPDRLFEEWRASVDEIVEDMTRTVKMLLEVNPSLQIILTVSPYRYHKYGYHGSQLSKATLLLAEDELIRRFPKTCCYFPAYEILLDELRDYRFYAPDGHHPGQDAVDRIWERFKTII